MARARWTPEAFVRAATHWAGRAATLRALVIPAALAGAMAAFGAHPALAQAEPNAPFPGDSAAAESLSSGGASAWTGFGGGLITGDGDVLEYVTFNHTKLTQGAGFDIAVSTPPRALFYGAVALAIEPDLLFGSDDLGLFVKGGPTALVWAGSGGGNAFVGLNYGLRWMPPSDAGVRMWIDLTGRRFSFGGSADTIWGVSIGFSRRHRAPGR